MPLTLSNGPVVHWPRPKDLIRRRKYFDGIDSLRKLTGDVEELVGAQDQENAEFEFGPLTPTVSHVQQKEQQQQHKKELCEDVQKHMHLLLELIKDLTGHKPDPTTGQRRAPRPDASEVFEQFIAADLPAQLLSQLPVLEFESRKEVMNVCCSLLCPTMPREINRQVVEYFQCHARVFQVLMEGYEREEVALHSGIVLRSCARHSELVQTFLEGGHLRQLMRFTRHPSMDISSDAFYTVREMLLEHKDISASWLVANFKTFFDLYNGLLVSGEYVAERQAQKLLAEILLDRNFRKVMLLYVSSEQNLQIHMNLLKDRSKSIQFEAFHIFKIFAANPSKPARIQQILFKNRSKLIALIEGLHALKPDDKKFLEDQRSAIDKLNHLEPVLSPTRQVATSNGSTSS